MRNRLAAAGLEPERLLRAGRLRRSATRILAVAAGALLVAGVSAGAFNFLEERRGPRPVASAQSLGLGPAPEPFVRPADPKPDFVEPTTPEEAVTRFLEAESTARFELSYALLDERSRRDFPVLAAWVADQADRPRPLGLTAARRAGPGDAEAKRVEVEVGVERRPAIDPFVGFVAAEAVETWMARLDDGKWRVEDRPTGIDPLVPPDDQARGVVSEWLRYSQDCDAKAAESLQVEPVLYGVAELAEALCDDGTTPSAGEIEEFDPEAEGAGALAAFGPGIDLWARVVDVAGDRPFRLTLAPLGADWRVLAISPVSGEVRP